MRTYMRFVALGLVLGLATEVVLKLVARIRPEGFPIALAMYPVILTLAFGVSRLLDRRVRSVRRGDVAMYVVAGVGGLLVEWTLLGNRPGSGALQWGMFAMWTTFAFGPRVLVRARAPRFWKAFAAVTAVLVVLVLLPSDDKARRVVAVLGLSVSYVVWSVWLLVRSRRV